MSIALEFPVSCNRVELDTSPEYFGELRRSDDLLGQPEALRARMMEDGYLYLPGLLDREAVRQGRLSILQKFQAEGALDENAPLEDGIARADFHGRFIPNFAMHNPAIEGVIYGERMLNFYRDLLGGPVRHFDFTWFRSSTFGQATWPHCDLVYMSRGTHNLYTAWTPFGDVSLELGGLMILEKSHQCADRLHSYLARDVDTFCENKAMSPKQKEHPDQWLFDGVLSRQPDTLPHKLGGRWLTTEFRMGDVLTFPMSTIHGSLDNRTNRIRLSSDSRYQLASEPADERWIGDNPPGHGPHVHRGVIC